MIALLGIRRIPDGLMYQGLYSPLLRQYMSKGEIPKLARVLADFTSHISGLEFDIEFREILFLNALESPIVVFDVETTGLHARLGDRIVEIGAIKVEGAQKISPCSVRRLTDRIPAGTMNRGLHLFQKSVRKVDFVVQM